MPSAVVDGNDLWAVNEAAADAVARARAGSGPTLLECRTYRHYGHSKSDPAPYRTKEEVEDWLERDPLKLARDRLLRDGMQRGADRRRRGGVTAQIDEAIENALAAPYPDPVADAATEFSA